MRKLERVYCSENKSTKQTDCCKPNPEPIPIWSVIPHYRTGKVRKLDYISLPTYTHLYLVICISGMELTLYNNIQKYTLYLIFIVLRIFNYSTFNLVLH